MAEIKQVNVGGTPYDLRDDSKLPKLSYEWNKEYAAGGDAGYLLIGEFPMYDSNVTVDIVATTSTTYHGTLVIATQNVSTTSIGTAHDIHVYGDPSGTISNAIRVVWTSGSKLYKVYFTPERWSKNFIHIRALALDSAPDEAKICKFSTGTAPATTSGLTVYNVLRNTFAGRNVATGASSGNTGNSSAFDSGAATGNTGNSSAFDSGAATGNTAGSGTLSTGTPSAFTNINFISGSFTNGVLTLSSSTTSVATSTHTHNISSHSHGLNSHKHSVGAHSHSLNSHKHSVGAHSHSLNSHTHTQN